MTYVPLWVKSNFSFLEGASHPDELVQAAHEHGLAAIALTDRDGVPGIVRAHVKALELGIKLCIGSQLTLDDGSNLVVMAQDKRGYGQLCRLVTAGKLRSDKGHSSITWDEILGDNGELLALVGPELATHERLGDLADAFAGRAYGLCPRHRHDHELNAEVRHRKAMARLAIPIVAGNEVLYHAPRRRPLQDVLTCIRHGTTLSDAGRLLPGNAEHDLKSSAHFDTLFDDDPRAVRRTLEVAERCTFDLRQIRYRYPSEPLPDGSTTSAHLRRVTFEGAARRFGPGELPPSLRVQLDKELTLIDELDYCGYFLTMFNIVNFCRAQDPPILCQGRGSAANSAVCYCLGVTSVDPTQHDLLFERFLSRERAEPPDIDLDVMHERREEVIQHIYATYGRDHAAMVANVVRYRGRSALREVGKALGLPESELDRIARQLSHWGALSDDELTLGGYSAAEPGWAFLLELAHEIQEFPRHLSIHPGGFLLGFDPIADLVPIENATMADRTVIQWDKYDVESLGLFKVDILGLGALTHLDRAFALMRRHRGVDLDMARLPPDDPATYDMCCRGDTVGVFQIESRAQMSMLPRLRPRTFYDLVIEISIVRPGPITGGMVHPYLRRRAGLEPIVYPHPVLESVLHKTLGVPLFQEQVMKLAMVAADYTPGEADQLRRDMAAWKRSTSLEKHRERLVVRMGQKGISQDFAERIFSQIKGFGEYGFPESHAASFALIAYATAYLKCHFHAEFTCALLNSLPMGFYAASTIVEDAKRHGVEVRPIDVRTSGWECTLEPHRDGFAIRMGLSFIKGLTEPEGQFIAAVRDQISSLTDFVELTRLPLRKLRLLVEAGALDALGERRDVLWRIEGLSRTLSPLPLEDRDDLPLLRLLSHSEKVTWDYRTTAHSPRGHPMQEHRDALSARSVIDARTLNQLGPTGPVHYAGVAICRQHPETAGGVTFMTLEDETGLVNVVVWKQVFERYSLIIKTSSFMGITGKLQTQDGVVHLIAESFWDLPFAIEQPPRSRDFH